MKTIAQLEAEIREAEQEAANLAAWAERKAAALDAEALAFAREARELRFAPSGGRPADKARRVANLQALAGERMAEAARLRNRYRTAA